MKTLLIILLAIVVTLSKYVPVLAQTDQVINLNTENGLPSNHVYGMITDKNGYLWICTDKGVVRYNGYECKLFKMSDGLPNDDIWELLEDRKGRIWLGNISDELGYIYNGKYHKVYLKDVKGTIFPESMHRYKDGIMFSSHYISGNSKPSICIERNDTIFSYAVHDSIFKIEKEMYNIPNVRINSKNDVYMEYKKCMFVLRNKEHIPNKNNKVSAKNLYQLDSMYSEYLLRYFESVMVGDYIFCYQNQLSKDAASIVYMNVKTGIIDTMNVREYGVGEGVEYINYNTSIGSRQDIMHVFTKTHVLRFAVDSVVKFLSTYSTGKMIKSNTKNLVSYLRDTVWGNCFGTNADGAFIDLSRYQGSFQRSQLNLTGFKSVGEINTETTFFWNTKSKNLLSISGRRVVKARHLPTVVNINKVVKFNSDTDIIVGSDNYYLAGKESKIHKIDRGKFGASLMQIVPFTNDFYFVLARTGAYFVSDSFNTDSVLKKYSYIDNFTEAIYDTVRRNILAYNHNRIVIFDNEHKNTVKEDLAGIGIDKLQKVCIDGQFGNIYLKGTKSLLYYDIEKNSYRELFKDINLEDAIVKIHNRMLVVAGRFGVLFCKIIGKGRLSEEIILHNIKNNYYKKANGVAISAGVVLLRTDKGEYEVSIPSERDFMNISKKESKVSYRLLVNYQDSLTIVKSNDTICINQENLKLLFDNINPAGQGQVVYYIKQAGDPNWIKLNGNEYSLPSSYMPDNYYTLQVYASDDAWKSDIVKLHVYVKPYWWQTHRAQKLIVIGGVLLALLIIGIAIGLTRMFVLKASKRKQLQMEMELKSIYAQINPHFIFNTLNSALLLVTKNKMDEAYNHISKFSRLLRSYLKSSRNKLITVGEEVENLRNYLELQQTRFKDKFSFDIIVGNNIDEASVKIPSLLLQPFVENAINHGITRKVQKGFIRIEFILIKEEKKIICTIDDDGIGRKQAEADKWPDEHKKESYGNLMIKDLISIFGRYEGMNIDIKYTDKVEPLSGTIVTITIKYPRNEQ